MNPTHEFNFSVQLSFRIAPVKFRLTAELLQQPFVEVAWRQLRIGQVEQLKARFIQFLTQPPDRSRFSGPTIPREHSKPLTLRDIRQTSQRFFLRRRRVQLVYRKISGERSTVQLVEGLKHGHPPPALCGTSLQEPRVVYAAGDAALPPPAVSMCRSRVHPGAPAVPDGFPPADRSPFRAPATALIPRTQWSAR
ncbi:hypothetical protein D3C81_1484410 [compost metagenome]